MSQVVPVGAPYCVAHFDEGPQLFVRIKGRFPLQFGRCVCLSYIQTVSESLPFLLDSLLSSNPFPLPLSLLSCNDATPHKSSLNGNYLNPL